MVFAFELDEKGEKRLKKDISAQVKALKEANPDQKAKGLPNELESASVTN